MVKFGDDQSSRVSRKVFLEGDARVRELNAACYGGGGIVRYPDPYRHHHGFNAPQT